MCIVIAAAVSASHSAVAGGIGALVIALAYAYSPRSYAIRDRSIVVRRLIGSVRIPLDGLRQARAATADDLQGCIRLWGSGGLFGYYGLFRTSKLGKSTWYVTGRSNAVVIVTETKTAVFSPDDVEGFLAAVRLCAPVPLTPGEPFLDSMPSYGGNRIGSLFGAAIGIFAIAAVALAMLYSPGPPGYTLTPESLTIHDRFYPVTIKAASVDGGRIQVVDLASDPAWRPVLRTNGFANSHYRSGWFRVANGRKVRMYSAGGSRLVLLPPKGNGAAVLLQVKQPERFVEELRQQWPGAGG